MSSTDHLDKKPRGDGPDETKLWELTFAFCDDWKNSTDALGARNVVAAFYLLCTLAQNSLHIYPNDEAWFEYVGRFLALYVRDTNTATEERVRLSPYVLGLMESKASLKGKVTVRTMAADDGPAAWAEMINADCNKATHEKVPEIVSEDNLADPLVEWVLLAAEYIKGDWLDKFNTTRTGAPFYGTGEDAPVGKCNMMEYRDLERSGGGVLLFEGEFCDAVLLPTTKGEGVAKKRTDFYGLVVLPKGEKGKPTDPEMLEKAAEEIKNNLGALKTIVAAGKRSFAMLEMPRIKRSMKPVELTDDCKDVLPEELMRPFAINNVTQVEKAGLGWQNSPGEVGAVFHATFLQVHETGFEAAAATAIVVYRSLGASDMEEEAPKIIRADRGFLFYLMDLGPQPHVLYLSRVLDDAGLKDAPKAKEGEEDAIIEVPYM
jgi:hypothetical protein